MNPHPRVLDNLSLVTLSRQRRCLKVWLTHAEQDAVMRMSRELHPNPVIYYDGRTPFNPLDVRLSRQQSPQGPMIE